MTDPTSQRFDAETRSRLIDAEMDGSELRSWQARFADDPGLADDMARALTAEARLRQAVADNAVAGSTMPVISKGIGQSRPNWWAIAAGVAGIVVGLGAAQLLSVPWSGSGQDPMADSWVSVLQQALETQPSGVPVALPDLAAPLGPATLEIERSYQAADGRYCRAYRQSLETPTGILLTSGVACRESTGTWYLFDLGAAGEA